MGSSRKSKSTRPKSVRPAKRRSTRGTGGRTKGRSAIKYREIPPDIQEEIESQRRVLITVMTLLYCLHVILEHRDDDLGDALSEKARISAELAYLPDMTGLLLDRVHAVHLALDSVTLTKAPQVVKR